MAATGLPHNFWKYQLLAGFDWTTADVRAGLFLADTWTPDPDDIHVSDATGAGAIEMTGYARQVIGTTPVSIDNVNDLSILDSDTITWTTGTAGIDYDTVVIFIQVTNDTDSILLVTYSLDNIETTVVGSVYFVPNATGLLTLT